MDSCDIGVAVMESLHSKWHFRKGMNMDSALDLVKAFDSVPRDGLFSVLEKFGIPPKMLRRIIRFHSDLIVKVNIGDKDVCFDSTTGVKQGCTMAPLLFAIYFQAANEVLSAMLPVPSTLMFKTEKDFVFSGRKIAQSSTALEFSFDKSLYADDKTKLSDSRENLQMNLQLIFSVFRQFGLLCHVGLLVDGGKVPFTLKFKLLGSLLALLQPQGQLRDRC